MIKREGYLRIDHRASPGMPGLSPFYEATTLTCAHCSTPRIMNPLRTRERGHCRKCDAYICDNPACHVECVPFDKIIDQAQEAALRGYRHG